jgi:molecular chaperone GrpE
MSGPNTPDDAKPEDAGAPAPENAAAPEATPKSEPQTEAPATPDAPTDGKSAQDARITELEMQVSELNDRYLRVHAEMDNIRKRSEREKADTSKYAIANFARDVLSVSDNLKRAISAVASTDEEHAGALKALVEGVELTEQELANALERHGVRPIPAEGELFDPNIHQAVMEQENKEVAAGSVLQVFQEGYRIGERVLRPSMVVVARGGPKPVKQSDQDTPTGDEAAPKAAANEDEAPPNDDAADTNGRQGAA